MLVVDLKNALRSNDIHIRPRLSPIMTISEDFDTLSRMTLEDILTKTTRSYMFEKVHMARVYFDIKANTSVILQKNGFLYVGRLKNMGDDLFLAPEVTGSQNEGLPPVGIRLDRREGLPTDDTPALLSWPADKVFDVIRFWRPPIVGTDDAPFRPNTEGIGWPYYVQNIVRLDSLLGVDIRSPRNYIESVQRLMTGLTRSPSEGGVSVILRGIDIDTLRICKPDTFKGHSLIPIIYRPVTANRTRTRYLAEGVDALSWFLVKGDLPTSYDICRLIDGQPQRTNPSEVSR